ncbi:hypothetical protein OIU78_025009, partial [Salix suchowensis]
MSPELAAAVSQQLSPQLLASEGSPTFSELFAPVAMDSPRDSDYDGSSAYNLDSSSHYGSPVLANLELKARISSPASSAPAAAEGPSEIPAASHSAAMDSAPMLQAVLVSAQGHVPGPSDQGLFPCKTLLICLPLWLMWGCKDNASLVTGMAFEAPAPAVAQARQPVPAKHVVSKGTAVETARNEFVDNGSDLEALTLRK